MKLELLEILRCPFTGESLKLQDEECIGEEVKSGYLVSEFSKNKFEIREFIPRFVPATNYADNFGFQWNHFRKTQLDSYSGQSISKNRFWNATQWNPSEMRGKWVLDIGCGSGRFAEVALSSGCNLVALDYSNAVDACYENLKGHSNLHIIQGNIYELPFKKDIFSYIYSLGVLQHTPDVKKAFFSALPFLEPEGNITVDFYEKSFKAYLLPKFWLRPITTKIKKEKLFHFLKAIVPTLLPLSIFLGKIPIIGSLLKRFIPVANYVGILPLKYEQQLEWSLLDTFDWLSPEFDNPQDAATVSNWLTEANLSNKVVHRVSHLVCKGMKK